LFTYRQVQTPASMAHPGTVVRLKLMMKRKKNKLDQKQGTKVNGKFLFFNSDTI